MLMLRPVLHGDWPVGHDHPVHVARLSMVKDALLEHGSLWTWSHQWFAGHPLNVTYPIGTDLFVFCVQALSFGQLPMPQAYAVAFLLFFALFGYATYLFVRSAVGSRLAGVVAVVFLFTDAGNGDIGGWFWHVDAGVWTAALGMVPALIGTVRLAALLDRPNGRTAAALALCVGLAVLCHPLHLIYFAIAVPLMCACRYIAAPRTAWLRGFLLVAVGMVCGLLIASIWLVPFLWSSEYIGEIGGTGSTLTHIGEELAAGRLFSRMLPLAAAFGFIGSIYLLRVRAPLPLFMGLVTFVCVTLSSSSFVGFFGPGATKWAEQHVILARFLMLLKPFWYGAAACVLVVSANAVQQAFTVHGGGANSQPSALQRLLRRAALALIAAVFVVPVVFTTARAFVKYEVLRPTRWHSERDDLAARAAVIDWFKKEVGDDKRFFRVAHGLDPDGHSLADLGAALPYPVYKAWFTPTGHFKNALGPPTAEAFRAANVRFVITSAHMKRPDLRHLRSFHGKLHIYEFRSWNPQPFEVFGAGEVALKKFTHKEIELRARPGATGQLRLNVTYYPKWRATRDRVPVPITPVPVANVEKSALMQVPLEPGTYRFRYHKHPVDYIGTVLGIVGLTGCAFLAFGRRIPQNRVLGALGNAFAFVNWRRVRY